MANRLSRFEIFAQAAKKLRADFEALSVVPHNALKGHEAEDLVRKFLNGHLPQRFVAGAGFIIDPKGDVSPQTDVVVYDAHNCPVYRASDDAAILPSNNVAAVFEVKSRLNKQALQDAWDKIDEIKGLAKARAADVLGPIRTQTFGVLFAFTSELRLQTVAEHYADQFRAKGIGRHIDLIVVLDRGIITLSAKPRGLDGWSFMTLEGLGGETAEGSHIAVSVGEFKEYTLDAFFRLLLPQLILYRGMIDHPGFDWSSFPVPNQQWLMYLTSFTNETDPEIRELKLKKYAEEVKAEFAKNPPPPEC